MIDGVLTSVLDGKIRTDKITEAVSLRETVYTDADITTELSDVQSADGSFLRTDVNANAWAVSLAGLYELTETTNLYANFSKGYFFPQLKRFCTGTRNR